MGGFRSLLRVLFRRQLRAADVRALWRRMARRNEFADTVDEFAPTRFVQRADEMSDGRTVHVGEGLEVSEEDLYTLPAELQDEFTKQSRTRP